MIHPLKIFKSLNNMISIDKCYIISNEEWQAGNGNKPAAVFFQSWNVSTCLCSGKKCCKQQFFNEDSKMGPAIFAPFAS